MASGNISSGDEKEPGDDPNEIIYDVPTSNREINDDPEANEVTLVNDMSKEPEVTNSTRDSSKLDVKFPEQEKCFKRQGHVFSTDIGVSEYVDMHKKETEDGTVVPDVSLTLQDKVYSSIDESKLIRPCPGENPDLPARPLSSKSPRPLGRLLVYFEPGTMIIKESNTTSENCQHILIQGIPEFMSVEDIAKHIETDIIAVENSIDTLKVNRIDKEVVVTLKHVKVTEELLERVASGEKITLGDDEVDVKLYEQAPTDPTKAFISGLGSATTTEDICQYFERSCGSRPVSVLMGEIPGTAMICLQNATDLSRIQKAYFWLSPEEKNWFISGVERSRKICVKAVAMDTTPETLKNYFENKETSLGGMTESIIFRSNSKDYIVTFKSIEDAENVVRKGNHMIGEVKLEVSSFHPCLYLSEETFTPKPSPIVLYNLNTYKCRFFGGVSLKRFERRDHTKTNKSHIRIMRRDKE